MVTSTLCIFPSTGSITVRASKFSTKDFLFFPYKFLKPQKRNALLPAKTAFMGKFNLNAEILFAREAISRGRKSPLIPGFFWRSKSHLDVYSHMDKSPTYPRKGQISRNHVRNEYICRLFTSKKAKEHAAPLLFCNR